jgi:hypothetical protein
MTKVLILGMLALASSQTLASSSIHTKTLKGFSCSGEMRANTVDNADRSIGEGGVENMCFFSSKSPVGQKILNVCKIGSKCSIIGTVKTVTAVENGEEVGDVLAFVTSVSVAGRVVDGEGEGCTAAAIGSTRNQITKDKIIVEGVKVGEIINGIRTWYSGDNNLKSGAYCTFYGDQDGVCYNGKALRLLNCKKIGPVKSSGEVNYILIQTK